MGPTEYSSGGSGSSDSDDDDDQDCYVCVYVSVFVFVNVSVCLPHKVCSLPLLAVLSAAAMLPGQERN